MQDIHVTISLGTWFQYHIMPKYTLFKTVTSSMSCSTHVTSKNVYCMLQYIRYIRFSTPKCHRKYFQPKIPFLSKIHIWKAQIWKNPHSKKKSSFKKIRIWKNPHFKSSTFQKNPHLKRSTFEKSTFVTDKLKLTNKVQNRR